MTLLLIPVIALFGLSGFVLLGLGGYALYESFTKEEAERLFLGKPATARIVGIVALIAGLALLCTPIFAIFFFGVSL